MRINLDYKFSIVFSEPVKEHRFAMRIIPMETCYYDISSFSTNDNFFHVKDGFGNIVSFGDIKEPHNTFEVTLRAEIDFNDIYHEKEGLLPASIFLFETRLTHYSVFFEKLLSSLSIPKKYDTEQIVQYVTNWIFDNFIYERGITTVKCGIDTIIEYRKGVCQDFAHLMIAILRYNHIPARYVSGFTIGEGESHAWVEYFDGYLWKGADPTHNLLINYEPYVKIAHGRDAADVAINKGVFIGQASQYMNIQAIVKAD